MCSSGDRDTAVIYMRHYHSTIDAAINQYPETYGTKYSRMDQVKFVEGSLHLVHS